ncbi:MAG TPA: family 3 encapsulin nanocompartment shell protein [Micromonosporaceae bacterium]
MRYLLADPALTSRTPGEEFARQVATNPGPQVVARLAVCLPTTFPLAEHRPRYTVRHLLKTATVGDEPVRYVTEPRPAGTPQTAGVKYDLTPEATFTAQWAEAELTELTARVGLPPGLVDDPAMLAAFVDHRVVVRLCTVENEALLQGTDDKAIAGLLNLPGLRRRTATGDLGVELTRAAAEVEEMGGSCDGIVAHPDRYWELVHSGLLQRLNHVGVRVSRTRMISPDQVLLGDFRAAVTLLDTGESTITLTRGGGDAPDVVAASLRVGLAVHLPQHFLLLDLA